jgi:hypothetical protein
MIPGENSSDAQKCIYELKGSTGRRTEEAILRGRASTPLQYILSLSTHRVIFCCQMHNSDQQQRTFARIHGRIESNRAEPNLTGNICRKAIIFEIDNRPGVESTVMEREMDHVQPMKSA